MSEAKVSETVNVASKVAFGVVSDYGRYPEFLPDVKRVSIIDSQPDKKLVEFEIQVIKNFRYQLWLIEKPFVEITWKLHSGDMFKENSGSWHFKDLEGGKTQIDYHISAKLGLFMPGMIEKKLIEINLPTMMRSYKERMEGL